MTTTSDSEKRRPPITADMIRTRALENTAHAMLVYYESLADGLSPDGHSQHPGINTACRVTLANGSVLFDHDDTAGSYVTVFVRAYLPYGVVLEYFQHPETPDSVGQQFERVFYPYSQIGSISEWVSSEEAH